DRCHATIDRHRCHAPWVCTRRRWQRAAIDLIGSQSSSVIAPAYIAQLAQIINLEFTAQPIDASRRPVNPQPMKLTTRIFRCFAMLLALGIFTAFAGSQTISPGEIW